VLLVDAALGLHRLVAQPADFGPVGGVAENVVVGNELLHGGVELPAGEAVAVLHVVALFLELVLPLQQRAYADRVLVARLEGEDLVGDAEGLVVAALASELLGGLDEVADGPASPLVDLPVRIDNLTLVLLYTS